MKKYSLLWILALIMGVAPVFVSCSDDEGGGYPTYTVKVQLVYPAGSDIAPAEGVAVRLAGNGQTYSTTTDNTGACQFIVPNGIYEATASEQRAVDGFTYLLNGVKSGIAVTEQWNAADVVSIDLAESKAGQIVIKELYNGGCPKNDGSGQYQFDKYAVLYNNSNQTATLDNLCLGMVDPYNANATVNNYVNGELSYAGAGYTPAINGIWYTQGAVTLAPGEQIVVALTGAINHTQTYSFSVDLSEADYCTYDMADYENTSYYPTPSEKIAAENYMLAYKYGKGNAWPLSMVSPAFYIFTTKGITPEAFASNPDYHYTGGKEGNIIYCCAKVPNEWIIDAVEVFSTAYQGVDKKRFTDDVDAGFVMLTNKLGHTLYRNVDKEATEALPENENKLVYGYELGVDGVTDASGIDAEASIKNGARIIYKDTNNSTNDFHERAQASLKD